LAASAAGLFGMGAGLLPGGGSGGFGPSAAQAATGAGPGISADEALALLKQGNRDYLSSGPRHNEGIGRERRRAIAQAQAPFCVLLGCSDSRVPPELLFGRGLGDLFIVRNAGNTEVHTSLGSVEYGVAALGAPLVVVLGHERCGAVAAAIEMVEHERLPPGAIGAVVEPIIPAVLKARSEGHRGEALLHHASVENVRGVVSRLGTTSALLSEPLKAGRLKIVGAHYDLDDGEVTFLG